MNDDSILGKTLGQLGDIVKATGQQIVKAPSGIIGGVGEQVGENTESPAQENKSAVDSVSPNKDNEEFIKGLYGRSENPQKESSDKSNEVKDEEFKKQIKDKTPEEQKKLLELRQQLHSQYYQNLVNPPKQQEERPAEKVENEKKQEMVDLQKKEDKKPQPLAVTREQNKAEQFRGASG